MRAIREQSLHIKTVGGEAQVGISIPYRANQVLETAGAISEVTTEMCFSEQPSGNKSLLLNEKPLVKVRLVRTLSLGLTLPTVIPRVGGCCLE